MSLNPLLLEQDYRDFWGDFDAAAIRNLQKLDWSRCCYEPRYYVVPDYGAQRLAADAGLEYILNIPAGSFIYGFRHKGGGPNFLVQISDLALNRKLFSHPLPDKIFANGAGGRAPNQPYFLPELYPVVSPGQFSVELWNTSAALSRISLTVAVAEVVS